jgi:hypothetical protein
LSFNGPDYFGHLQPGALGLHDKLTHFLLQQTRPISGPRFGEFGDNRSNPRDSLKQTLLDEMLDNLMCCVRVNL